MGIAVLFVVAGLVAAISGAATLIGGAIESGAYSSVPFGLGITIVVMVVIPALIWLYRMAYCVAESWLVEKLDSIEFDGQVRRFEKFNGDTGNKRSRKGFRVVEDDDEGDDD